MLSIVKSITTFFQNLIYLIRYYLLRLYVKIVKNSGKIETGYGGSLNAFYAVSAIFSFSKHYLEKDLTTPLVEGIKNKTRK